MNTPVGVIAALLVFICALVVYLVIRRKRDQKAEEEREIARGIALAKMEQIGAKGDMLAKKADATVERVDRLIALLELTTDQVRESDEEEESNRKSAVRRRHGE